MPRRSPTPPCWAGSLRRCYDIDVVDAATRVGRHHTVDIIFKTVFRPVFFDDPDAVSFGGQEAEVFWTAAVGYAGQYARGKLADDYRSVAFDCARKTDHRIKLCA